VSGREVYIYWRLADPVLLAEATHAVRAMQQALQRRWPALQTRLLVRDDGSTLMEIYTEPGGISGPTLAALVSEGDTATARWRQGQRHLETFAPA
jgi:hypothetical protein